ncbi:ABC transporter ATP-binding protein [Oharaeibacter diazotrophicus]|uniref:Amino acid/amide ABC transporter ATP-binding protein 1 (HAAT family) n=1 Tax=Oharaeibacter diazotrophicus TaxID=1920512 RepID=A0A4R6R7Q0_9HYPH|nr:ABC transporter ATP-binding protein [Oharaeibacter diazotrophicus]TDP82003.1 amino acid/amide ABC transporter ATP-binding protein 1 (HAAT family) [Oharaeibacter diazotrophicus]BBE73635.1 lipopolysaccharide export system ATP-binding protein LptB [Pleomorphomonas sp. SM30]GLS75424.1 ABC transporter ATP-binding protein [Oharaeibacter diazotrophicus]
MHAAPPTLSDAPGTAAIETRNVVKRFGGVAAVDGVSLAVRPGEIVGLIGPNGAGKTTMFDLLAGRHAPTSGEILVAGRPVQHEQAHRRLAAGLGRTFQIPRPFPEMTLTENVMTAAQRHVGEAILPNLFRPGRVAAAERAAAERARALLDFVALGHLADQPARVLSGGQRKLLELARVMMAEPATILLDEPAAGVNRTLLGLIVDRILAVNARGVTFLVIEHDMDMVARLCGRVYVMAAGRLLAEGAPAEVARDRRVVEAYLGGAA